MAIEKLISQQVQNAKSEKQELAALRALGALRQSVDAGNKDFSSAEAIEILGPQLEVIKELGPQPEVAEETKGDSSISFDKPLGKFLRARRKTLINRPEERAGRLKDPGLVGVSAEFFARRVSVSVGWLYKLEQGKETAVSYTTLRKIAKAADLTPEEQEAFIERYRKS